MNSNKGVIILFVVGLLTAWLCLAATLHMLTVLFTECGTPKNNSDLNRDGKVTLEDFSIALNQVDMITQDLREQNIRTLPAF